MRRDLSVQCGSSEHAKIKSLAGFLVVLWPVGMVIMFVTALYQNREQLRSGAPKSPIAKSLKLLTGGYRPEYFYWEIVDIMRRLTVCGWVVLIPYDKVFFRIILAISVSLIVLVMTASALPCKRPEDNFLSIFAQSSLVVAFGCCALIRIIMTKGMTDSELDDALGFHTTAPPFFVLCFIVLAFLFALVSIYFYNFSQEVQKYVESRRAAGVEARYSPLGALIGALSLGLSVACFGGFVYGMVGGIVSAILFGALGSFLGMAAPGWCGKVGSYITSIRSNTSSSRIGSSQDASVRPDFGAKGGRAANMGGTTEA